MTGNVEATVMNQHVPNTTLMRAKKPLLWTPWGTQRLPDLDKALEATPKRTLADRQRRKTSSMPGELCKQR